MQDVLTKIDEIGIGVVARVFGRTDLVRKDGYFDQTERVVNTMAGMTDMSITGMLATKTQTLGKDTIRVDIQLAGGAKGHFVVPAGTSTGEDEAKTVGVEQALINVRKIHKTVVDRGLRAENLTEIAQLMLQMGKDELGAEATLGYLSAVAWAAAHQKEMQPYELIREIAPDLASVGVPTTKVQYNITNGGEHAENSLDMQEFMVVPVGATAAGANNMCDNIDRELGLIYQKLGLDADTDDEGVGPLRGKEGGYKVENLTQEKLAKLYETAGEYKINNLNISELRDQTIGVHEFVLNCMLAAIKNAGYTPSTSGDVGTVSFAFDPATSEMEQDKSNPGHYNYEGQVINSKQLANIYAEWVEKYPIDSIEDGMSENDWDGWIELIERIGDKVMLIGDDNLVTQSKRLMKLIDLLDKKGFIGEDGKVTKKLGILIKLNQNGFLTTGIDDPKEGYLGTLEVIRLARKYGIEVIISHRSKEADPEENEVSIAELAAGVNAYALKSGDHVQGIRAVKEDRFADICAIERAKLIEGEVTSSVLFDKGEAIMPGGLENEYGFKVIGEFRSGKMQEIIKVVDTAKPAKIIGNRDHSLIVKDGEVIIIIDGEALSQNGQAMVFSEGDRIAVGAGQITVQDKDGSLYECKFPAEIQTVDYEIIKNDGSQTAVLEVDYDYNNAEKGAYAVYGTVRKYQAKVLESKGIDIFAPRHIYDNNGEGSAENQKRELKKYFGGKVKLHLYNEEEGLGSETLTERVLNSVGDSRKAVLIATESFLKQTDGTSAENLLASTRILAIPDVQEPLGGFIREIESVGILQGCLNVDDVYERSPIAMDMQRLMAQLVGGEIGVDDLYYMLPFARVKVHEKTKEIFEDIKTPFAWAVALVKKVLLDMKMVAIDPTIELKNRQGIMWSA